MYSNKLMVAYPGTTELDASGNNYLIWTFFARVRIKSLLSLTTTVMSSTAAVVLTFYLRPTFGSTSGEASMGTLSIGATSAVADVYYKRISGTVVPPGQCLAVKVTTAASTSGKCIPAFEADEEQEPEANLSKFIASA